LWFHVLLSIPSSGHSPQHESHVTEQETSDSESEHETSSLPNNTFHRTDLQYVFGLPLFPYSNNDEFNSRQRIKDIQTAIAETTALHAQDYFEHLYSSLTNNSNDYQLRLSVISDALKLLERYSLQARTLEAELVEENEAGKLSLQAQQLTQTLRDMTGAAEELWCFIVGDPDATKLIQQYSRGELRFQRPNIDK
jgi:hypothetical protein